MGFNIASVVGLLKIVPQVVAAAPEFVKVFDQIKATFASDVDQKTLQDAYEIALSDAADAHQDLDDIVERNSSE